MEYILMVLFQYIREHSDNDTNIIIAKKLINNIDKVKDMNLERFSELCACSPSTATRFFREIGLKNFTNVKAILEMPSEVYKYEDFSQEGYYEKIINGLMVTRNNLSNDIIERSIKLIKDAKRVIIFGFENTLAITLEFQCRMMMKGKYVEVLPISSVDEEVLKLTNKDLAIFISFKGNYFTIEDNQNMVSEMKGKTILITENEKNEFTKYFDLILLCGDNSLYGEGMYSLLYILNTLCANYK